MNDSYFDQTEFITRVPSAFFPAIGKVMVSHAFADQSLNSAIIYLSKMDFSSGMAVLSPVTSTMDRIKMLKYLARAKMVESSNFEKLDIICNIFAELGEERNTIAHSTPYSWSPLNGELSYHKSTNLTVPQITQKKPYHVTLQTLDDLADQFLNIGIWLKMLLPVHLPDAVGLSNLSDEEVRNLLSQNATYHPNWDDDALFPWLHKLKRKVQ